MSAGSYPRISKGRRLACLVVLWGLGIGLPVSSTLADEPVANDKTNQARVPVTSRRVAREGSTSLESSGGWWLGSVGVAAALMVFGGVSLASKRLGTVRDQGAIQVVGRTSLGPKHSLTLVRIGERLLIVGLGPQGAPSSLGEITDPDELARLIPGRATSKPSTTPRTRVEPERPAPSFEPRSARLVHAARFDQRIGDDE